MESAVTYVECSCGSEVLRIEHDPTFNFCEIAILKRLPSRTTWLSKIVQCWQILTNGEPYGDEIVLAESQLNSLVKALTSIQNLN